MFLNGVEIENWKLFFTLAFYWKLEIENWKLLFTLLA